MTNLYRYSSALSLQGRLKTPPVTNFLDRVGERHVCHKVGRGPKLWEFPKNGRLLIVLGGSRIRKAERRYFDHKRQFVGRFTA